MSYLLRNKPDRSNKNRAAWIISVFVILLLIVFLLPNILRRTTLGVAQPVWFVGNAITKPFSSVVGFFRTKNNLVSQNLSLQDEIAALNLKLVDYDVLSKENSDLKALMGRTNPERRTLASVLSAPPNSPYDTLVIDAGSGEGILPGSKVYISDTILIGFVTDVTTYTSLVELYSTGGRKQESVLSRTGAQYTLTGNGGTNFKLEIPKDADILWGDSFLYPSLSSALLGTVYYIDTNSQSSFKTIYIRIPQNAFSSKYVFVEK